MEWRRVIPAAVGVLAASLMVLACNGSGNGDEDGNNGVCKQECTYYHECAQEEDCDDGCCRRARRCTNDDTCQPEGKCVDGRCIAMCVTDLVCPEEAHCVDGFCEVFPQAVLTALSAPAPDKSATEKQPLRVGISDVAEDFPVGVSMAGYGARLGPRTPYRHTLGGSDSMFDRPRAKVFVFDNGLKRIILIKAPMSWSTDFMASHVAYRVHEATGENYLNRMVFSAPHSHSHPGRYWNILAGSGMGVLGHGDFDFEIFWRISDTLTSAVLAALDDLQPAKFGYAYLDPMDPEGLIHGYRRGESSGGMLGSLVLMRIDDTDGNPRAVLVNFALHGTHFGGTTVSQDAPGGVEVIAQEKLQDETGQPVKVAFISGASGDVSPSGDGSGLDDWRKVQEVGIQAWPKIKQLFDGLEGQTTDDIDLDIANRRAPVSREHLGYGDEEFYDTIGHTECSSEDDCSGQLACIQGLCGEVYHYGGFQCVLEGDEDPGTSHEDGDLGCIFSALTLADGHPITQFGKTRLTVFRLGDLGLITVPGEPLGKYSRDLVQTMVDAGFAHATIVGYSQTHHLYVMHEENWLQGGYEPSMGIWGWKEGDYYYENTCQLIDKFASDGGHVDDGGLKPTWFELSCATDADCDTDPRGNPMACSPDNYCMVVPTATASPGEVITDVPGTVERVSMARFVWTGGHPGVDLPRMILEREDGGWTPVLNAAGEVYSDDGFSTMLWYRGNYEDDHTWEITWEEHIDFPTGHYRIRIDGHAFDGSAATPYQTTSQAFDFVPCARMVVTAIELTDARVSGVAMYPNGPTNDDGVSAFDGLAPLGFLHHAGVVPPTMPWPTPVDGTVVADIGIEAPSSAAVAILDVAVDTSGLVDYAYVNSRNAGGEETTASQTLPSSGFGADHSAYEGPGEYIVTVTVTDSHGNTGTASQAIILQ